MQKLLLGGILAIAVMILRTQYSTNRKLTNMAQEFEDLTREVSETRTLMGSAITLIKGLKERLDAAGTDPVKLRELSNSLDQGQTELAEAITANTPEDPNTESPADESPAGDVQDGSNSAARR